MSLFLLSLFFSSCSFFAKKDSAFQNSFTHLPFFSLYVFPSFIFLLLALYHTTTFFRHFLFFRLASIFPFLPLSLILFSSLHFFSLIVCLSFSVILSLNFDFFSLQMNLECVIFISLFESPLLSCIIS